MGVIHLGVRVRNGKGWGGNNATGCERVSVTNCVIKFETRKPAARLELSS